MYENGFFQLVSYEYETPLWFYCKNIEDSKVHVSYETKELREEATKKC